jgi:endonuclease/exonuclease/phosphatase family metal-dependent hydrolase
MKNVFLPLLLLFAINGVCAPSGDIVKDTTNQLSILTWNLKMLPRGGVFLKHHPIIRARIIPAEIMKESPDVLVFQEMFDGLADGIIRKKLKAMYPYSQGFQNRFGITYKRAGGVLIFSKYPLKEIESITYSQQKGVDKIGHKGCLLVEVQHPAGKIQVLGTHMQAGGKRELKISQYTEAGELLRRHQTEGIPQFACGDFNTHKEDTFMYNKLVNLMQVEDGDFCSDLKCSSDHGLCDMGKYNPKKKSIIDYVFFRGNGTVLGDPSRKVVRFTKRWSKKHEDLSDHFAVLLKAHLPEPVPHASGK